MPLSRERGIFELDESAPISVPRWLRTRQPARGASASLTAHKPCLLLTRRPLIRPRHGGGIMILTCVPRDLGKVAVPSRGSSARALLPAHPRKRRHQWSSVRRVSKRPLLSIGRGSLGAPPTQRDGGRAAEMNPNLAPVTGVGRRPSAHQESWWHRPMVARNGTPCAMVDSSSRRARD